MIKITMEILQSIILGIIQGLTEFIPVSSSGHLVLARKIFGFKDQGLSFDVLLHLATFLAVVFYFWKEWPQVLASLLKKEGLGQQIIIACLPAFILGIGLKEIIDKYFRETIWVATFLIIVGFFFFLCEKSYSLTYQRKKIKEIKWKDALIIGLGQTIALFPGISRSGMTICFGMLRCVKRNEAAKFSFLVGSLAILGAGIFSFFDLVKSGGFTEIKLELLFGFIFALASGYLSIKFLLRFLENHRLNIFAYYLIILGTILFVSQWI